METAAFKTFRLKSRQAILTDVPVQISEFLPQGHKVLFSKDNEIAVVTLYGMHNLVPSDKQLPTKRTADE